MLSVGIKSQFNFSNDSKIEMRVELLSRACKHYSFRCESMSEGEHRVNSAKTEAFELFELMKDAKKERNDWSSYFYGHLLSLWSVFYQKIASL